RQRADRCDTRRTRGPPPALRRQQGGAGALPPRAAAGPIVRVTWHASLSVLLVASRRDSPPRERGIAAADAPARPARPYTPRPGSAPAWDARERIASRRRRRRSGREGELGSPPHRRTRTKTSATPETCPRRAPSRRPL